MSQIELSAVVPVFNEVENVAALHAELTQALQALGRGYEIIFVDDGSSDGTFEALSALRQGDSHLRVVKLARNYGQTAAMAAGFDQASGTAIAALDGDGQNDPADIAAMLAKLEEGYDVVAGWRLPRKDPFLSRRLPSILANRLIGRITGVRLHDYGCTLKVMRSDIVKVMRL